MAFQPPQVGVEFTAEGSEVSQAIKTLVGELRDIRKEEREAKKSTDRFTISQERLERSIRRTALRLVALVGGFELMRRSTNFLVGTAKDFQQLEQRLVSITGSELQAARALELITDFARTTPFEIQNIVEAFASLNAAGLTPTVEELRGLGNFAAAQTKDINTLVSAVLKAGAGNSRELQKFRVIASAEGDKLRVTFRGVTHEINRDFQSVLDLFVELGNSEFGDAMERQMLTVGGATSNLQDTVSLLAKEIGERGLNAEITRVVRTLDDAIGSSDEFADVLSSGVAVSAHAAAESLIFLINNAEEAVVVLEALGGAAVARGLVGLVTRLIAVAGAAGGIGSALVGLLGGPVGAILTLSAAVAVPLLLNLNKVSNEVQDMIGRFRELRRQAIAATPVEIGAQISEANDAIAELKARIKELEGRTRTVQLKSSSQEVPDPQARKEAEALRQELEALEERRLEYVQALEANAESLQKLREEEEKQLTEEQRKKIAALVAEQQSEIDALRLTERELLRKKLAEAGAGEAATRHALALFDEAAALREQEKVLKDVRAQLDRLPEVRQALLESQGDTVGALRLQLKEEYGDLISTLLFQADYAGVQLVQSLIDTRLARARLQELEEEFSRAREALTVELDQIQVEQQSGAITATEAQERVRAAYQRQIDTLKELLPALKAAAEATGDPAALQRVRALETELARLGLQLDRIGDNVEDFTARAREALQSDLVDFLTRGIDEAENLGDAFADLASSIIQSLRRIAAELAVRAVLGAIFPEAKLAEGGTVGTFAQGGPVRGPGGPTSDTVPAMLSPGEYVVRAAAVKSIGIDALEAINEGMRTPVFVRHGRHYFAGGGFVEKNLSRQDRSRPAAAGATPRPNVEVHIHSNQDPRAIARHATEEIIELLQHNRTLFP